MNDNRKPKPDAAAWDGSRMYMFLLLFLIWKNVAEPDSVDYYLASVGIFAGLIFVAIDFIGWLRSRGRRR